MRIPAYLFLFISLSFFSSCVTDISFKEQGESIPVVNCVLTNDSIQKLSLTRSVKVSDSYIFKEIKEAKITLRVNDSLIGSFIRIGYDNWQLKYIPQAGKVYRLKIELSDGRVLTASTTMPQGNRINLKNDIDKYPSKNFVQYTAVLPCWIVILESDSLLLPKSRPNENDNAKDDIGTNHPFADRFNQDGNLIDIIPTADTPKFSYYIRIQSNSVSMLNGISFKLQANFGYHTSICFRTASVEYDQYLKTSMQKVLMRLDNTDPVIWFDESNVFSNINNGTGIFGAYYDQYFNYNDNESYYGI